MAKAHHNGPHAQGIREFFGKKYIWLINHEGNLTLHGLHRPPPKDDPAVVAQVRHAAKLDETGRKE